MYTRQEVLQRWSICDKTTESRLLRHYSPNLFYIHCNLTTESFAASVVITFLILRNRRNLEIGTIVGVINALGLRQYTMV